MAEVVETSTKILDITRCLICLKVFTQPKVLPCFHTFCLKCLMDVPVQTPGQISCSQCHNHFTLPSGGVLSLPDNFFITQLLKQTISATTRQKIACDVCSEFKDSAESAAMYCVNCEQNLCTLCGNCHKQQKPTMSHKLVHIATSLSEIETIKNSFCKERLHQAQVNTLYCYDCKAAFCELCYKSQIHKSHSCSSLDAAINQASTKICIYLDQVSNQATKIMQLKTQLQQEHFDFIEQLEAIKFTIIQKTEDFKSLVEHVECHKIVLLDEISTISTTRTNDIECALQEIDEKLTVAETFVNHYKKIMKDNKIQNVCSIDDDLKSRVKDLSSLYGVENNIYPVNVTFKARDFEDDLVSQGKQMNLVGRIEFKKRSLADTSSSFYLTTPKLLHSTTKGKFIVGISCLGEEIFVIRRGSSEVEVYNVETFKLLTHILVDKLLGPWDMTSLEEKNSLYICDWDGHCVFQVGTDHTISKWLLSVCPSGISVTSNCNLLVSFYKASKVSEYNSDGQLIKEFLLPCDVHSPLDAVKLTTGQFVISHDGDSQQITLLNKDGCVERTCGEALGSDIEKLNNPRDLAVDGQGFVLVSDSDNDRILMLSPALIYVRELIPPGLELHRPWRQCLDEKHGLLYVGEGSGGRLLIFRVRANGEIDFNQKH